MLTSVGRDYAGCEKEGAKLPQKPFRLHEGGAVDAGCLGGCSCWGHKCPPKLHPGVSPKMMEMWEDIRLPQPCHRVAGAASLVAQVLAGG